MTIIRGFHIFNRGWGPDGPSSNFFVLASWHNPKSITWRWGVYWWLPRGRQRFGFSRYRHNCGGHVAFTVPLVGTLSLDWQHPIWREQVAAMRAVEKLPPQEQRKALRIVAAYFGLEVTP